MSLDKIAAVKAITVFNSHGNDLSKEQSQESNTYKISRSARWASVILIFMALLTLIIVGIVYLATGIRHAHASDLPPQSFYPAYALAVRSPYLSTWLWGGDAHDVTKATPHFWAGQSLTWNVMARVSPAGKPEQAQVYTLFGFPRLPPGAKAAQQAGRAVLSSTHTTVDLHAGDVQFNLDFFSPVSPNNHVRQSLPYSYLSVNAHSADGHDVEIFSSIDDTWVAKEHPVNATLSSDQGTNIFEVADSQKSVFKEKSDMAQWGSVVFATQPDKGSRVASQCGAPKDLYDAFTKDGKFGKSAPFDCHDGNHFAHVQSISNCVGTCSIRFAIGHYREDAVNYLGKSQTGFFRSQFNDISTSLNAFLKDYDDAQLESKSLDRLVRSKGETVSSHYADILENSVRQTFGALELTVPGDTRATDSESVNVFLKEISSNGDVQTIDVIYPSFPLLYLICPDWIGMMLQPVMSYVISSGKHWDMEHVPHDMGVYPNADGHNNNKAEHMPIESTGQLMALLLTHARATKNFDFYKRYSGAQGKWTLERYADFLVRTGLHPPKQLSSVDALEPVADQTQLAMTAAIGISAYGILTGGNNNYTEAGAKMTQSILNDKKLGSIADGKDGRHFTFVYDKPDSWSVMYPLFTDKLLALTGDNSFSSSYPMQTQFYANQLRRTPSGLEYKNDIPWAITDWNLWSAAVVGDKVKDSLIESSWRFMTNGKNQAPFPTKYNVEGNHKGEIIMNKARSTVGGNFAVLATNGRGGWDF